MSSERSLWCAVILQALEDATSRTNGNRASYDRAEAQRWFSDDSKEFKRACQLAGMEADSIRKSALEAIAQSQDLTVERQRTPKRRRPKGLKISFEGKEMTLKEWSQHLGVNYKSLAMRLVSGWSIEKAFHTPVRHRRAPGVVENFGEAPRDRCGSNANDPTKTVIFS